MKWFVIVALVMLVLVPGAGAAPPPLDSSAVGGRPVEQVPQPIGAGFVGIAQVGPMYHCIGLVCPSAPVDSRPRGCRRFVAMPSGAWRVARTVWSDQPEAFFAAPYAPGWHWTFSLGDGYGVIATKCLWGWQEVPASMRG